MDQEWDHAKKAQYTICSVKIASSAWKTKDDCQSAWKPLKISPMIAFCSESYCSLSIPPFSRSWCHLLNWSIHSVLRLTRLPGERLTAIELGLSVVDMASACWGSAVSSLRDRAFPTKQGRFGGSSKNSVYQHWSCEPKHWIVQLSILIHVYPSTVSQQAQPQIIFQQ